MKNITLTFILFLIVSTTYAVQEQHYDSIYVLGNTAYQNQKYDTALQNYSSILDAGLESADLFYNTANCYYKLNEPTKAILYYEKALKTDPTNKDIQHNLELSNKLIVDKIESLPKPFFTNWWLTFINTFSVDVLSFLCIGFLSISVILLLVFFRTSSSLLKRISFFITLISIIGSIATYIFAYSQYNYTHKSQNAIVFSKRVNIYSAPNTTSTTLFIVHDGLKVEIIESENNWHKITLPDGSIGWITEESIVKI